MMEGPAFVFGFLFAALLFVMFGNWRKAHVLATIEEHEMIAEIKRRRYEAVLQRRSDQQVETELSDKPSPPTSGSGVK